jgi:hypothetical protein
MKTLRLTIKQFNPPPVPPGYPMCGVPRPQRYVYRIRRSGSVIGSGITSNPAHPDAMMAKVSAA